MAKTATKPSRSSTARSCPLDDPDVHLMLRVCADEEGAFQEFVDRFGSRIFGHFLRTFGNRQDSEDLTQEVLLRVYRARKGYKPQAKFATWLFHVTQNVARNAVRSRRRRPCVYLDTLLGEESNDFLASALMDHSEEPSRPLERAEVATVVREAVSDLGCRQRTAVELHQFEHWTYNEVAQKMKMTPEAAKSLLYRARIQLRERLAGYFGQSALRT